MNGFSIEPATVAELAAAAGLGLPAVAIEELGPGRRHAALHSEAAIYPASMIKTPLAVAAAAAVAAGRAEWSESVAVTVANMTVNDAPSPLRPGVHVTLGELLELMLARSDNVATNLLFDRLGRTRAGADIAALGFPGTAFRRKLSGALPLIDDPDADGRNTHPCGEACALFARIARAHVPGARRIASILAGQYWNTKLSAGLAAGDRFAHKTGDTDEVSHDGGILSLASGERYAIAVYTQIPSSDETDRRFAAFMRLLRPLLVAAG